MELPVPLVEWVPTALVALPQAPMVSARPAPVASLPWHLVLSAWPAAPSTSVLLGRVDLPALPASRAGSLLVETQRSPLLHAPSAQAATPPCHLVAAPALLTCVPTPMPAQVQPARTLEYAPWPLPPVCLAGPRWTWLTVPVALPLSPHMGQSLVPVMLADVVSFWKLQGVDCYCILPWLVHIYLALLTVPNDYLFSC